MYGLLSGLSFAMGNVLNADLSAKYGIRIISVQGIFSLASAFYYHYTNKNAVSIYYDDSFLPEKKKPNCAKVVLTIVRSMMSILSQLLIFKTFYYVSMSPLNLNSGIISSIFSSTILYSTLIFYVVYGQKLSMQSIFGILLILAQVFLISTSQEEKVGASITELKYIHYAVVTALLVGFSFTLNLLCIKVLLDKY
jgi:drug/metabolite transporter (DMT)-like permease